MDYDTFDTDVFSEINDMPGEIYDVIEYKEEYEDDKKFDVDIIEQNENIDSIILTIFSTSL